MFTAVLVAISAITHAMFNGIGLALGFTIVYGIKAWYENSQGYFANGYSWKECLIPPLVDKWIQAKEQRTNPEAFVDPATV